MNCCGEMSGDTECMVVTERLAAHIPALMATSWWIPRDRQAIIPPTKLSMCARGGERRAQSVLHVSINQRITQSTVTQTIHLAPMANGV